MDDRYKYLIIGLIGLVVAYFLLRPKSSGGATVVQLGGDTAITEQQRAGYMADLFGKALGYQLSIEGLASEERKAALNAASATALAQVQLQQTGLAAATQQNIIGQQAAANLAAIQAQIAAQQQAQSSANKSNIWGNVISTIGGTIGSIFGKGGGGGIFGGGGGVRTPPFF